MFSYPHLGLPRGFFTVGFESNVPSSILAICTTHLNLLNLIPPTYLLKLLHTTYPKSDEMEREKMGACLYAL